ncbi:MAG: CBS domain-containing protein [Gammaproteobacteria bacterium]|nr:CBS domain-containing protein [Gammaproteobacteria bacterium]
MSVVRCSIESLISEALDTMDQSATVQQGVALMAKRNIGSLIVTNREQVVGLFTERDLITRVVGVGRAVTEVTLGEVCTRKLVSISSGSSCHDAIGRMEKNRCRRLVVYRGDHFIGLVNLTDVAAALARNRKRNNTMVNLVAGLSLAAIIVVIALLLYNLPRILQLADRTMS